MGKKTNIGLPISATGWPQHTASRLNVGTLRNWLKSEHSDHCLSICCPHHVHWLSTFSTTAETTCTHVQAGRGVSRVLNKGSSQSRELHKRVQLIVLALRGLAMSGRRDDLQ